jgi:hypothetical protein
MGTFFTTTETGKCDVTVTLFTSCNTFFLQRSRTFDVKPTIKEFKEEFKQFKKEGAKYMRITTTPSCNTKIINL